MEPLRPGPMSVPGMTETTEAVARARAGDNDAWGQLYWDFAPAIFRFCRRALPTREDAEDATMDIFIKLQKNLSQYDETRSFSAWLTGWRQTIVGIYCGGAKYARTKRPKTWTRCLWSIPTQASWT